MNGFIKLLTSEVAAYEESCFNRIKKHKNDPTMIAYSFACLDKDDPNYSWYRIEDDIYNLESFTEAERLLVELEGNFE